MAWNKANNQTITDFHPKFSISNDMCPDIWYFGPVWSTWTSHGIHGSHYDSNQHYLKEKYISKQSTHALPQKRSSTISHNIENCRFRYENTTWKIPNCFWINSSEVFGTRYQFLKTFLCNDFFIARELQSTKLF